MPLELGHIMFGNGFGQVELDRQLLQEAFVHGMWDAGIDNYACDYSFEPEGRPEGWPPNAFSVGDFVICPYQWDMTDDNEGWFDLPNLWDRRTDTKVWWYKYALRDPTANRELGVDDVNEMMARLKDATRKLGSKPYEV